MDRELNDMLARLRSKAEDKRDKAKAAADAEFAADMQSIKRLAALDGETEVSSSPLRVIESKPQAKRVGGRKNGPTAAVRTAIGHLGNGFSVATLMDYFAERGNGSVGRPAIYSSLNKMTAGDEIRKIPSENGGNSRAYEIVKLKKNSE